MSFFRTAAGFPYVSKYGQPTAILHEGDVYLKVPTSLGSAATQGGLHTQVVALETSDDDLSPEDDPMDVDQKGPNVVVFNQAIYHKSLYDPAFAGDDMLRTVVASDLDLDLEPQHAATAGAPEPAPLHAPIIGTAATQEVPLRAARTTMNNHHLAGWLASQSSSANGVPKYHITRSGIDSFYKGAQSSQETTLSMPPRSAIRNKSKLALGFDLSPVERAATRFIKPLPFNYYIDAAGKQQEYTAVTKPARAIWVPEHKVYCWELVKLATLQMNRQMERKDFMVITEALHRRFQGTTDPTHGAYPLRGFNSVHTMVTKHPSWAVFNTDLLN
ncbi:uncharacterized protein RAG0_02438 [Rhynchosporium agropyri]|uniref:Uncharacterized protein n=1 Tax=Rhynchosporium agropyri TaxID=914238 RepID=A0A1E1K188_9HELO|nr:uncharacterized protein RAG0_02438 [Rhynchosporium agropyri]